MGLGFRDLGVRDIVGVVCLYGDSRGILYAYGGYKGII